MPHNDEQALSFVKNVLNDKGHEKYEENISFVASHIFKHLCYAQEDKVNSKYVHFIVDMCLGLGSGRHLRPSFRLNDQSDSNSSTQTVSFNVPEAERNAKIFGISIDIDNHEIDHNSIIPFESCFCVPCVPVPLPIDQHPFNNQDRYGNHFIQDFSSDLKKRVHIRNPFAVAFLIHRDFPESVVIYGISNVPTNGEEDIIYPSIPLIIAFRKHKVASLLRSFISQSVKKIVPSPGERLAWKAKKLRTRPPGNYYIVKNNRKSSQRTNLLEILQNTTDETDFERSLTWRHDRAAHLRLRLYRGTEELSVGKRNNLLKRGYVIYEKDDILGPRALNHLVSRGRPEKQDGEWMAMKVVSVRDTIVGPENAPYVPGVRV